MDACRGISALAIVACHTYPRAHGPLVDWDSELRLGVNVFFALSGFLLFRPYLAAMASGGRAPSLRDYLTRRVLRIVPAYWCALTILAILLGSPYVRDVFSPHWWLFYGFGQVYSEKYRFSGIPVAWSLSVEASFYLFLPLFAAGTRWLARTAGWRTSVGCGLGLLFALGLLIRVLNQTVPDSLLVAHVTFGLPGELLYFAVGMALAMANVDRERRGTLSRLSEWMIEHPGASWSLAAACFVFGATFGAYVSPVPLPGSGSLSFTARFLSDSVVEAAFALLVLIPAVFAPSRSRLPQRILSWRVLSFLGLVSYGMYLWHVSLGAWVITHTPLQQGRQQWPLFLVWSSTGLILISVALLAGTASYYAIELPFLKRKPGWRLTRRPDHGTQVGSEHRSLGERFRVALGAGRKELPSASDPPP